MVCNCRHNRHTNNSVYDTLWVVMAWQHTKTFCEYATPSYTPCILIHQLLYDLLLLLRLL